MKLLLISNSTNCGEAYLDYPKYEIKKFLEGISRVLFIPYAGVTISWNDYKQKVKERFDEINIEIESIHEYEDPIEVVRKCDAIVVGGGNTWHLLKKLQENKLIDIVREKVFAGTPYVGWSAGSNVACPTIMTTNDMPIVELSSFKAFGFIPFQINPHYTEAQLPNHAGETRQQRISEFIHINREIYVVGLPEGCMLKIENEDIKLIGQKPIKIFKYGEEAREYYSSDDISFLLRR